MKKGPSPSGGLPRQKNVPNRTRSQRLLRGGSSLVIVPLHESPGASARGNRGSVDFARTR